MQVAPSRRKAPDISAMRDAKASDSARATSADIAIQSARQDYLNALPIAAAILCGSEAGDYYVETANDQFRRLAGWDHRVEWKWINQIEFLNAGTIGPGIADFFESDEPSREFEARDGQSIGCRHFMVKLARLKPNAYAARRCLISLIDRTAQVETEKSLRAEMLRDSLTGLPNRLAFNERVEAIIEDPDFREGSHAVLVVDMTRFSRINESMGAIAGDEMLITFARRLFSALRASDVLARTGGDEFGILLKLGKGVDEALNAAERIRAVLATPFRLSELEIKVDCAIGCALLTRDVVLAEEVLRNAQFALRRAKYSGETRIYEPTQARAARRRFSIETELRRAIEAQELRLNLQPLVSLERGTVCGFEALARWEHEERGAICPTEFVAVAEESGLIVPLGRWALDAATQILADWDHRLGRTLPICMSVNVSAIQIARSDIVAAVSGALAASGLDGGRLKLELTESAIIQDPERASKVLGALRDLGVQVAMDDFGTGYTSLASLQRMPIDILKIDRSFVTGMLEDPDSVAIVRAILSLANALGMETTAEGIESENLARALTDLGCTRGQGFFFAPPLEPDAALDYWLARNT